MEKARLYLTLDNNRLKIEKGKNWANKMINRNKLDLDFNLIRGCQFIVVRNWHKKLDAEGE